MKILPSKEEILPMLIVAMIAIAISNKIGAVKAIVG